jgi:nicotinamide-nucleotide amidase
MKVEIVSVGTKLLMSDTLDTNTPYISRSLREVNVPLTCKVTVGDDVDMITDVLKVALKRADVVIMVGNSDDGVNATSRRVVAKVTGRKLLSEDPGIAGAVLLGGSKTRHSGLLIEEDRKVLICLPGNRREMSYLLDTEVLPFLQERLPTQANVSRVLLRTVDITESSLKQRLADLTLTSQHRIRYDSFAGQTTVQLWAEADPPEQIGVEFERLKQEIITRLGDHIYGEGDARLEDVVLQALGRSGRRLAIAESQTNDTLIQTVRAVSGIRELIVTVPERLREELLEPLEGRQPSLDLDLSDWSQAAAKRLLTETGADLGLVVFKQVTQGGVQIFVTLASSHGVSVTQRSFGGHPENINHWALTLGLAHLRRWLLAHH